MSRFVAPLPGALNSRTPSSRFVPPIPTLQPPPAHPSRGESSSSTYTQKSASERPAASVGLTVDGVVDADDLSEAELRRVYEDEEIQRTLAIFATHVTEVILPGSTASDSKTNGNPILTIVAPDDPFASPLDVVTPTDSISGEGDSLGLGEVEEAWINVEDPILPEMGRPKAPPIHLSEWCAAQIAGVLPPPRPRSSTPPKFKLSALGQASRRLYMSTYAIYPPYLYSLMRLALWEEWGHSAKYCALYWILWTCDLLLPALVLSLIYSLVHRRLVTYPTAEQLKARRKAAADADAIGAAVDSQAGVLGGNWGGGGGDLEFGARLAWRLFRGAVKGKKKKVVNKAAGNAIVVDLTDEKTDSGTGSEEVQTVEEEIKKQQEDWKRAAVAALEELADLHERLRNMFLWRRPEASRRYVIILVVVFMGTLFLPARILAKLVYFLIGVTYWFLVPVLVAMTPDERSRFPPAFAEFPTDADYAIEIIGQRMARGESVVPLKKKKEKKISSASPGASTIPLLDEGSRTVTSSSFSSASDSGEKSSKKGFSWTKLTTNAMQAASWVDQGIKLVSSKDTGRLGNFSPSSTSGAQIFPAHYGSNPGMLTLTPHLLTFTPFLSTTRVLVSVDLAQVRGVRKSGQLGGISIRHLHVADADGSEDEEKTVKFQWVGRRDELFAKLVGWGGRRWVKV